ncbi:VOC family protein [Patulibacter minatonensis]|uniref:VOC family protein n=1 Tax=Patulibacter minatonensis TaxID=298163 RepID=UPI00047E28FC|nr:VOC family protein [Patulibacter minatonensis]
MPDVSAPTITPNLWFDTQAHEAAEFYVSVFPDAEILDVHRYGPEGMRDEGTVMLVVFRLGATRFCAINGGPQFTFDEAVSFEIECQDQEEVDRYWEALIAGGGAESRCGWCKDRFGLSWQVVPKGMGEVLSDPDRERAGRAMKAMLGMRKLDLAALRRAADGEA